MLAALSDDSLEGIVALLLNEMQSCIRTHSCRALEHTVAVH